MKSFKVDCKNIETSKLMQEHLFSIGYEHFAGGKTISASQLYAYRDGSMAYGSQEDYFQSNPAEELQIHEVFALKKEEEKKVYRQYKCWYINYSDSLAYTYMHEPMGEFNGIEIIESELIKEIEL